MQQNVLKWEIEVPATDEDFLYIVYISNTTAPVEVGREGTYNQAIRQAARNLRHLAREFEEHIENQNKVS